MLAGVYDWIKNIAFYIILVTTILNVLPEKKYQKYLKLLIGVLMIILIMSPVLQYLKIDKSLDLSFIKESYEQEMKDVEKNTDTYYTSQNSRLKEMYEDEIKSGIESLLQTHSLHLTDLTIQYNDDTESDYFGNIEKINIQASAKDTDISKIDIKIDKISPGRDSKTDSNSQDSALEIQIKNEIENFYNIPIANININIQE